MMTSSSRADPDPVLGIAFKYLKQETHTRPTLGHRENWNDVS